VSFISPGAASNLVADGAYVVQVAAPPQLTPGPASNVLAVVGSFTDGKPNTPIRVSTNGGTAGLLAAVGSGIVNNAIMANSGVREVLSAGPEATEFVLVRPTDGTETNATSNMVDNTGFATENIVVATNAGTSQTIALAFVNGSTTVNVPSSGAYAVPNGQTPTVTAAALAALINNSPAVLGSSAFIQAVTPSVGTIPVNALAAGTAGNSITIRATVVGSGQTVTPSSATAMSGGAAPSNVLVFPAVNPGTNANGMTTRADLVAGSTSTSPVYNITVNYPYNPTQVWRNIIGYATAGGGYDAATFKANALAQINGTAPNSVASPVAVVSAGSSTAPPLTGVNNAASGGSNGGPLTPSMFVGQDGNARKGMYALRGQSFGGILFAGVTDPTVAASMASFLDQVGGIGFTAFPSSTLTDSAVTTKNVNNINYARIISCLDWDYFPDVLSGQNSVLVSPMGAIAGIIMSIPPWFDPSNKPEGATKAGVLATEKTTTSALPVDPQSEGAKRKTNGIMYLTNGQPRTGRLYGLPHGKASDGSNILDTRTYDYVARRVLGVLSRYVGRTQTPPPTSGLDTDATRTDCNADMEKLRQDLISPTGVGGQKLAAFRYVFISTAPQVAAGYLAYNIFGTTLAGIEFAIGQISVGSTVPTS
jgi:hypothetical protein